MAEKNTTLAIKPGRVKRLAAAAVILLILAVFVIIGYFVAQHFLEGIHQEELFKEHLGTLDISAAPVTEKERDEYNVAPDHPRYIHIPSIGVNKARVLALGLKKVGADGKQQLDSPKNISDVGWYDCGINPIAEKRCDNPTLPGAGITDIAAILTGHTCFSRTLRCVFDSISKLKNGDSIIIERGDGEKINYTVRQVEVMNLADVDMAKAMRPIKPGEEGLTLITCAGTYQGAMDANGVPTADKRVLVYAVRDK